VKDVAARAGVSIATVSRVINDRGVTRSETAERVRAAIQELGFRPHGIGRSLKTARTRTIGVMIPSLANPVFAEAVTGMESAAKAAGYSLLLASSGYRESEEHAAVETLRCRGVDGLILTVADSRRSLALDALDRDGIPYVLVYNAPTAPERPTVTVDNEAAGREVVEQFLALGHRRLGMVAGSFAASDRSRARHGGFLAGAADARLGEPALIEIDFANMRLAPLLRPLFESRDRPTALFCSNDLVAIAAIGALRELGLRVPAEVSVIGFDGIAVGALVEPTLATIVQPSREMGREAALALIGCLSTGAVLGQTILAHGFRAGGSLDRAPLRHPIPRPITATGGS
jgi:DNA-binding LacI/PurR family transcriptional regulator